MKDSQTMAFINAYAILSALENLCELDDGAKRLVSLEKPIAIRFKIKGGPTVVYTLGGGKCTVVMGEAPADIYLYLFSTKAFNKMVDGAKVIPLPLKGLTKLRLGMEIFTKLGDILMKYLRPTPDLLLDKKFFKSSTTLMANVVFGAICEIGNNDPVGKFSAANIPDGKISIEIGSEVALTMLCTGGHLALKKAKCETPRAVLSFSDLETARAIFDGKENPISCIGKRTLAMKGFIPMVQNMNNILSRVPIYL